MRFALKMKINYYYTKVEQNHILTNWHNYYMKTKLNTLDLKQAMSICCLIEKFATKQAWAASAALWAQCPS